MKKDTRNLKISYTKSGAGNESTRVTLPVTWIREMGLSQEFPAITATFDGEKILIEANEEANESYYFLTIIANKDNRCITDDFDNAFFKNTNKKAVKNEFDSIDFDYISNYLNCDFDNAVVEMWKNAEELGEPIAQKFFEKC